MHLISQVSLFNINFYNQPFIYFGQMLKLDIIDYKTKNQAIIYLFAPAMGSKNTITGNINVFEALNINKLDLSQENLQFKELFIIWWSDLKTKV